MTKRLEIGRRQLIAAGAGVGVGTSLFVRKARAAAEFRLKYAHNLDVTNPLHVRAAEAVARIKEQTNGRVQVDLFPNNQLGGDTDMLSQIRAGAIDFFTLSGLTLATLVPVTAIYGMAFAFPSYQQAWAAMDGDLGNYLRAAVRKAGVGCLDTNWDNGYRQFISGTKPIDTPEVLRGFKIRVPVSPLWTSVFQTFGASPVSINFSEVYSALQTKLVDGFETTLVGLETSRFYEVQKYVAMVNYLWDNYFFLVNQRSWGKLPPDLQKIVSDNFNKSGLDQRADTERLNGSLRSTLEKRGMVFSDPDFKPFRAALQQGKFYETWRAKFGEEPWGLLEKYTGNLI
jgi:tripartite ATP-independent transporter DctP family solute receptor